MVAALISNIWNETIIGVYLSPTQVNHEFHWTRDAGLAKFQPLASDRAIGGFKHNEVFAD
jgi:hypothetical protein